MSAANDAEMVHTFVCHSTGHGGSCADFMADYDAPSWRRTLNGLRAVTAGADPPNPRQTPRTVDMAGRPVAELDTRTLTGEQ